MPGVVRELCDIIPDTQFIDCDVVGLLNGLGHFAGNTFLKTAVFESVNKGVFYDVNDLLFLLAVCICLKGDGLDSLCEIRRGLSFLLYSCF